MILCVRAAIRLGAMAAAFVCLAAAAWGQEARLLVTVFDEKTGGAVPDLQPEHFTVEDAGRTLAVEGVEFREGLLDLLLLVDTSKIGEVMRPLAAAFVDKLGEQEQMALVSFHTSADLLQDFTNSKRDLLGALQRVRYGNNPRVLDALYAAVDGGFASSSAGRRVIVLLAAGAEGRSRVSEAEVTELARRRGVSIYPVYYVRARESLFRDLAAKTGGANFAVQRIGLDPQELCETIYSVLRGHYVLTVSGVYTLGPNLEISIDEKSLPKSYKKVRASGLPLQ